MRLLAPLAPAVAVAALALSSGAATAQAPPVAADGRIVFATDDGMASINPDGSGAWGLRFTRIGRSTPAWSPDGSAIAFTEAGDSGIYAMDPDGTNVRPLVQMPVARNAAWSPDGQRIAFDDWARVYTARADGGGVTRLVQGSSPAWSPDGTEIAYEAAGDIHAIELSTGVVRRITSGTAYDTQPAWSPDGSSIAFASGGALGLSLHVVKADGSARRQITDGPLDSEPAWSPEGSRIAFVRHGHVWVVHSDGSGARQLVRGNAWSASPAWQPLRDKPADCTLAGTRANDLLVGGELADVICGGAGDDSVIGLGGQDLLVGGDGSDWIAGGLGTDILRGEAGDDRIDARDDGIDRVDGGPGRDSVILDRRDDGPQLHVERRTRSTNVSVWRPTTASNEEATNPSVLAVNGRIDDYWSSGGYPTQWIEVDLRRPTTITRIRLITPDLPARVPVLVLGRSASPTAPYRLLHRFSGPTAFKQEVRFRPKRPWRNVQHIRLQVPLSAPMGWVSWPEIEIHSG